VEVFDLDAGLQQYEKQHANNCFVADVVDELFDCRAWGD
jgi:hypothetical protein